MRRELDFDLLIVGGGPAGISAAISASSEGLNTVIIESKAKLGGQVVDSSLVENVPGFPKGISGRELMNRSVEQALKFGTVTMHPFVAESIVRKGRGFLVTVRSKEDATKRDLFVRVVLIAGGLSYKPLEAANVSQLLGKGVFYGPGPVRKNGKQQTIYIVGGANSAGQAAMNLSRRDYCRVVMLVRGASIEESMSTYLCNRVRVTPNIEVWTGTTVMEVQGEGHLHSLILKREGEVQNVEAHGLHIFIGASPKTEWLRDIVKLDPKGFILTGHELLNAKPLWRTRSRTPIPYETSRPGIFCIGDMRQLSIKRVAAAMGEGSAVVARIHEYLAKN